MLQSGDQKNALLQQLLQVVNSLVVDQQTGQLTEEAKPFAQQLKLLQAQVQDTLGRNDQRPPTPAN
jgi:hypothetical protein